MESQKFIGSAILGFCFGIVGFSFFKINPIHIACVVFVCLVGWLVVREKFYKNIFLGLFTFFLGFILGFLRMQIAVPDASYLSQKVGTKVSLTGIVEDYSQKDSAQQFVVDVGGIGVLVKSGVYPVVAYGDSVRVEGSLKLPENFMTSQGTEFDYVSYLYKDDILFRIGNAKVFVVSHGHGNFIVASLNKMKDFIIDSFHKVLSPGEADLLAGLNLGEKSGVSNDFRNDLITTGTIHIIALSGYNVTIVATFLRRILSSLPSMSLRFINISGAFGVVFFVLLTGAQSSAVRAGIMALVALYGESSGHRYNAFRALVLSGLVMILYDPKYLVYDISFQLSFLATIGIIFITPIFQRMFVRLPEKFLWIFPIRELASATLGAQVGVLPFILYKTGNLSLISLPANIFVLPAIPFAMGFGALAGFMGIFSVWLARPFAFVTHLLLFYITHLIQFFAKIPLASVVLKNFPLWLCLVFYFFILIKILRDF